MPGEGEEPSGRLQAQVGKDRRSRSTWSIAQVLGAGGLLAAALVAVMVLADLGNDSQLPPPASPQSVAAATAPEGAEAESAAGPQSSTRTDQDRASGAAGSASTDSAASPTAPARPVAEPVPSKPAARPPAARSAPAARPRASASRAASPPVAGTKASPTRPTQPPRTERNQPQVQENKAKKLEAGAASVEPEPVEAAPPPSGPGCLVLQSTPPGADVWIGGKRIAMRAGSSGGAVQQVEPGSVEVQMGSGASPSVSKQVKVEPGSKVVVRCDLLQGTGCSVQVAGTCP